MHAFAPVYETVDTGRCDKNGLGVDECKPLPLATRAASFSRHAYRYAGLQGRAARSRFSST